MRWMKTIKIFYGLMLILWFIASIITSILPSDSLPIDYIFGYDKLLHAIKFIIFSIILYNFLHYTNLKYASKLLIFIPLQFYPFVDELLQLKIPSRTFSEYDILANYIGLMLGIIISVLIRIFIHKKSAI